MAAAFRGYQLFLLILLIATASVSAVLFTPALPALADYFHISQSAVQWTMTLFLLGYAVGPLPYGPIANRFGRKKAIYIGMSIAVVGTLLCLFTTSFLLFLLGRLLQALGTVAGFKIAFTMIGDKGKEGGATKVLSYILFIAAAAPALGVVIGGFLTSAFTWRGCFVFLLIYVVYMLIGTHSLPETSTSLDKNALQWKSILHGYLHQFKNAFLYQNAFIMGIGVGIAYVFATIAPHIAIEHMGISESAYGLWNFLSLGGVAVGFYLAGKLSGVIKGWHVVIMGIFISLAGALLMIILFAMGITTPSSLFFPMIAVRSGYGISYITSSGQVLTRATDKSNASAVMQFITMGLATFLTLMAGAFLPAVPMGLAILFFILICIQLGISIRLRC